MYALCKDDQSRKFPESSVLFYMWSALEDAVLTSWLKYLERFSLTHCSLHYDGVRLSRNFSCTVDEICKQSADHIFEDLGIRVKIREAPLLLMGADPIQKPKGGASS